MRFILPRYIFASRDCHLCSLLGINCKVREEELLLFVDLIYHARIILPFGPLDNHNSFMKITECLLLPLQITSTFATIILSRIFSGRHSFQTCPLSVLYFLESMIRK